MGGMTNTALLRVLSGRWGGPSFTASHLQLHRAAPLSATGAEVAFGRRGSAECISGSRPGRLFGERRSALGLGGRATFGTAGMGSDKQSTSNRAVFRRGNQAATAGNGRRRAAGAMGMGMGLSARALPAQTPTVNLCV